MLQLPEKRDELIQYLETLTSRTLRTREDVALYVRDAAVHQAKKRASVQRWMTAKKVALGGLLIFSIAQYYVLDVMVEIISMQSTVFFVPASVQTQKS